MLINALTHYSLHKTRTSAAPPGGIGSIMTSVQLASQGCPVLPFAKQHHLCPALHLFSLCWHGRDTVSSQICVSSLPVQSAFPVCITSQLFQSAFPVCLSSQSAFPVCLSSQSAFPVCLSSLLLGRRQTSHRTHIPFVSTVTCHQVLSAVTVMLCYRCMW